MSKILNFLSTRTLSAEEIKAKNALRNAKTGVGKCTILCVGDSTTYGARSVPTGDHVGHSYPNLMADMFYNVGYDTEDDTCIGFGSLFPTISRGERDIRYTETAGEVTNASFTVGGPIMVVGSGDTIVFTPDREVDTFKIYTAGEAGTYDGVLGASISGGSVTNIDSSLVGTGVNTPTEISVALGSHDIEFTHVSGGDIALLGFEAYDSTKTPISILNAGVLSAKGSHWRDDSGSSNAWSPRNMYNLYDPNIVLLCLGINEWSSGVSAASFKSNYEQVVDHIRGNTAGATGGVPDAALFLVTPVPSHTDRATIEEQDAIVAATKEVGAANGLITIDNYNHFGGQYEGNEALMDDQQHPNASGYSKFAQYIFGYLNSL